VKRAFSRFVGVDLGGGRGKTTALAEVHAGPSGALVVEVATRFAVGAGRQPWTDETLIERLVAFAGPGSVVAIDAPLTQPACSRCTVPVCPGIEACVDPAVIWLRTEGRAQVHQVGVERGVASATAGRVARAESINKDSRPRLAQAGASLESSVAGSQARLAPYAHRATEVMVTYGRGLLPIATLGAATGTIAARAYHLARRLRSAGYQLHDNLLEVSPAATIAALVGPRAARGYKRDADPWQTRALILEQLGDLTFAPRSRMAREDVLQNDHCFDAVIAAYTAYLWARDGWTAPEGWLADDGWITVPPS
jgi:predicted nuclease with RNAse H fold